MSQPSWSQAIISPADVNTSTGAGKGMGTRETGTGVEVVQVMWDGCEAPTDAQGREIAAHARPRRCGAAGTAAAAGAGGAPSDQPTSRYSGPHPSLDHLAAAAGPPSATQAAGAPAPRCGRQRTERRAVADAEALAIVLLRDVLLNVPADTNAAVCASIAGACTAGRCTHRQVAHHRWCTGGLLSSCGHRSDCSCSSGRSLLSKRGSGAILQADD